VELGAWSRTAHIRTLVGLGGKTPLERPERDDGFGVGRPDVWGIADMACLASNSGWIGRRARKPAGWHRHRASTYFLLARARGCFGHG
jgi:hypothetical protein